MAERRGVLKEIINKYKYESVRCAAVALGELLGGLIEGYYTIVPLPTIRRHVRERGFDHIGLLARRIVRVCGCEVDALLFREKNAVQVGSDIETRKSQAKQAYGLMRPPDADKRYLLLDDVCTTGSTLLAAEKILRRAGARSISVAVIAKSV